MKLTYEEKLCALRKRSAIALECIGSYFLRAYDSDIHDSTMRGLIAEIDVIEKDISDLQNKHAKETER